MRSAVIGTLALAAALVLAPCAGAELLSKGYEFKDNVTLEIGESTEDGLRIDTVRFHIPPTAGSPGQRTGGLANAEIAISNVGSKSRKVGVALALFDEQGRLLGVASAGTSMMPLKPGRQRTYTLVFDHVNGQVQRTTRFQFSLESKN